MWGLRTPRPLLPPSVFAFCVSASPHRLPQPRAFPLEWGLAQQLWRLPQKTWCPMNMNHSSPTIPNPPHNRGYL